MSDENNGRVIVRHHIITEEVIRPSPKPKKEESKEKEKWCWTRIQEARLKNANNTKECSSEVLQILLESCGVFLFFIFENLIGIVFTILGILFLNDCPISQSIPISLIVYGVFSIIHGIILQLLRWKFCDPDNKKDGLATCAQVMLVVTTIIYLVAFIWAVMTVFGIRKRVKTETGSEGSGDYCHPFLYWFAFWYFVCMAILGFILIILLCCLICFILSGIPEQTQHRILVVQQPVPTQQPNGNNQQPVQQPVQQPAQEPNVGNQSSGAPQPTTGSQPTAQ